MKKIVLTLLLISTLAGLLCAQGFDIENVAGVRSKAIDVLGNTIPMPTDLNPIWTNTSISKWWSNVETGYLYLDWGELLEQGNGLPDEIIDGFTFTYGTNNIDAEGETFAVYFFDSCTGWGQMGLQEAFFSLSGLPNGYGLPTLPPGYGWIWQITVKLDGEGGGGGGAAFCWDFPLDGKDGI